ncbi:hypothetical protein Droror1_Dr00017549 [Drosera rotundifolia]
MALKDLDLNFVFHLQRSWHQELIRQVDRDCEFLEAEKIMDYSLLIGLHFRDDYPNDEMSLSPTARTDATQDRNSPRGYQALSAEPQDTNWIMEGQQDNVYFEPANQTRVLQKLYKGYIGMINIPEGHWADVLKDTCVRPQGCLSSGCCSSLWKILAKRFGLEGSRIPNPQVNDN